MKESWPRGEDGLFLATLIWYGENQSPSRSWPLVVSSGLAHHVHKGHQGVVSCLPPLTTCPHSTLWRTQEHDPDTNNQFNLLILRPTIGPNHSSLPLQPSCIFMRERSAKTGNLKTRNSSKFPLLRKVPPSERTDDRGISRRQTNWARSRTWWAKPRTFPRWLRIYF